MLRRSAAATGEEARTAVPVGLPPPSSNVARIGRLFSDACGRTWVQRRIGSPDHSFRIRGLAPLEPPFG